MHHTGDSHYSLTQMGIAPFFITLLIVEPDVEVLTVQISPLQIIQQFLGRVSIVITVTEVINFQETTAALITNVNAVAHDYSTRTVSPCSFRRLRRTLGVVVSKISTTSNTANCLPGFSAAFLEAAATAASFSVM